MVKGGSGLTRANLEANPEPEEVTFRRFISGSEIVGEPMEEGNSGFLLRYYNSEVFYKSTDADTYQNPVHTILVKFVSIENREELDDFNSEVSIQRDIYDKTKDGLEPLCPAIVFSGVFEKEDSIITDLNLDITIYPERIGVIAMEFMEEYESMGKVAYREIKRSPYNTAAVFAAAAFLLIELAEKTGYTQGDFHFDNIFFKVLPESAEYPYFLTDEDIIPDINLQYIMRYIRRLKPIIIDFGMATKINARRYHISQMYNECNFRLLLGSICAQGCRNKYSNVILAFPDVYGWASGLQTPLTVVEESRTSEIMLTKIYDENLQKTERYLNDLRTKPRRMFSFFKNAEGTEDYCNMPITITRLLNSNFDGEDGIMSKMITARANSNVKIKRLLTPQEEAYKIAALTPQEEEEAYKIAESEFLDNPSINLVGRITEERNKILRSKRNGGRNGSRKRKKGTKNRKN